MDGELGTFPSSLEQSVLQAVCEKEYHSGDLAVHWFKLLFFLIQRLVTLAINKLLSIKTLFKARIFGFGWASCSQSDCEICRNLFSSVLCEFAN